MPPEIMRRIALYAIDNGVPGPPKEFYSLILTCKALHRLLATGPGDFYYRMFTQKFDERSPLRRLGKRALKEQAGSELRRRFNALKRIRQSCLDDTSLTETLWIAYTMVEDVSQINRQQLLWARLPIFLDEYVRNRLYEGSEAFGGWPLLNERNSLAIALLWLCNDKSVVEDESEASCDAMLRLLQPYVFAAFRYPMFNASSQLDKAVEISSKKHSHTTHGPYPPDSLPPSEITYLGSIPRKARVPLISLFSSLLYFTRVERVAPTIPPHLETAPCRTRTEAALLGQKGPTVEDVIDFVDNCNTRFLYLDNQDKLRHNVPSFALSQDRSYTLGLLTGRWQGSFILPFIDDYQSWLKASSIPSNFKTTGRQPLFVTLHEHYTCDRAPILPYDHEGMNTWLTSGYQWSEKEDGIEVFDNQGKYLASYKTYHPEGWEERKVADIIVTGKTDDQHAAAWGGYSIIGRIRDQMDGCGTTVMQGYVDVSQNFVGRLKGASCGIAPAGWEGVFVLCRASVAE
ncbi:hypothetical protein AMATHDRAFT_5434 [Amanita thiersii Skay4041]|uniref:F-box domain-containing protein n=1 Tax=Amanita thiersii Skay4041 TaxID=703135 RepID=A0A2A9NHQ2_9AGAR|nr:hypothetical protein AMATHDRAFT_5434 [Amanita thiersii Skay4041]